MKWLIHGFGMFRVSIVVIVDVRGLCFRVIGMGWEDLGVVFFFLFSQRPYFLHFDIFAFYCFCSGSSIDLYVYLGGFPGAEVG